MILLSESELHRLQVEDSVGIVHGHGGRLLVDLHPPGARHLLQQLDWLHDRPGGELGCVAEASQLVDITE